MQLRRWCQLLMTIAAALCFSSAAMAQAQKKPDRPARKAEGAAPLRDLFLELDANSDRVIDRQEVPESSRKAFDTLLKYGDADHDGKLEAAEYRTLLQRL